MDMKSYPFVFETVKKPDFSRLGIKGARILFWNLSVSASISLISMPKLRVEECRSDVLLITVSAPFLVFKILGNSEDRNELTSSDIATCSFLSGASLAGLCLPENGS